MRLSYLELGKIVSTHGVKGELKVEPWCDDPSFFKHFNTVYLGKAGQNPHQVVNVRTHGKMVLLTLEGVTDMDQANLLRNKVLYVDRDAAPLEQDRYFVAELLGCTVSDADTGEVYGTVADVTNTGSTDIWQIRGKDGQTFYMPLIPGILQEANVAENCITVRPIPGIFTAAEEVQK